MRLSLLSLTLFILSSATFAQPSYFPPTVGTAWETTDPTTLGWCQSRIDSLYDYLEAQDSKAFILLIDGKIVLEQYFNGHSTTTPWYWASAGKTLTAFMVGIAQQEEYLDIEEPTATYLGDEWTFCTANEETDITVRHQLSMTTGLDDGVADLNCTLPECLECLAAPGTRWSYHNAPYTLLDQVIESATGVTLNQYTTQKLKTPTGMTGTFNYVESNNVFFSNARSMARFGLLMQNGGNWDGNPIMTDTQYFTDMVNTSQDINQSYGYLWWLSGKPSFMLPGFQTQFPGSMMQHAPSDCIMALGLNGQFINVSTSSNMVWIRMGNAPVSEPVPYLMNDVIWDHINRLECTVTGLDGDRSVSKRPVVYPNPFTDRLKVSNAEAGARFTLFNPLMQTVWTGTDPNGRDFSGLNAGVYFLRVRTDRRTETIRLVKE